MTHGSATVGWLLTAVCAFVAGVCLLRAEGAGGMRRRAARSEALMGLGMAAMALPGSAAVPLSPLVFLLLFGTVGVRELARFREGLRRAVPASGPGPDPGGGPVSGAGPGRGPGQAEHAHHLHHIVCAMAMIYMALAMPAAHSAGPAGHAGGAAGAPLLTGALLAYYAVYVLFAGVRLLPHGSAGSAVTRREGPAPLADLPGLAPACRVAMATGMLGMLLMM